MSRAVWVGAVLAGCLGCGKQPGSTGAVEKPAATGTPNIHPDMVKMLKLKTEAFDVMDKMKARRRALGYPNDNFKHLNDPEFVRLEKELDKIATDHELIRLSHPDWANPPKLDTTLPK